MGFSIFEFVGGFALVLIGSRRLPDGIDRLSRLVRMSSGHLGLLTALAANSPEITAAMTALVSGAHDAGYGVVFGSNLFNLAGLLGVGALVAGQVELRREALALHGGVGVTIMVATIALVVGWVPPYAAVALIAALFGSYVVLLGIAPAALARLPGGRILALAVSEEERAGREENAERRAQASERGGPTPRRDVAVVLAPSLGAIVLGGIGLMRGSLDLAGRIGVSRFLVGALLLASLTGVPNVYTSVQLAQAGRGRALVRDAELEHAQPDRRRRATRSRLRRRRGRPPSGAHGGSAARHDARIARADRRPRRPAAPRRAGRDRNLPRLRAHRDHLLRM